MSDGAVSRAIKARRSARQFGEGAVSRDTILQLVALACAAPAPHHLRPWRFVHVASKEARQRLAETMIDAWRHDLEADGTAAPEIARRLALSERQIAQAPALLVACLSPTAARRWRDGRRRRAERDMFIQSMGAALQNMLLAAEERGLVGYLKGAPLFCPQAVVKALELPPDWEPTFLVLLGRPAEGSAPKPRRAVDLSEVFTER